MNNSKGEILIKWSPLNDEDFILVGSSVLFYHIFSIEPSSKNRTDNNLYISESSYARLVGAINNYPNSKSVSWYPGLDSGWYTIALHENNTNQIKVLRLFNQAENQSNSSTLELENPRKSNQIEWNPIKFNYLALGFDKLDDSSSICILDAVQRTTPIYQLDEFETCHSFSWHPENSDILLASSSNQSISLYDLRIGTKPIEQVYTDFLYGLSIDPKNTNHAVTYNNNKVAIWDLRKIRNKKEPFSYIDELRSIKKVQFCPSKANRLAVLTEGSSHVNVFHLEEKNNILYKEPIQYLRSYKNSAILSSFSWHSKDCNKLMVTFPSTYNVLMDLVVADYSPIGLSANETLNIALNDKIAAFNLTSIENEIDIGEKIKQRALKCYGVQDFLSNINLLSSDKSENDVKYLWQWLDQSNKIYDKSFTFVEKYSGIKTILQSQFEDIGYQNIDIAELKRTYILKQCGWFNWTETVQKLETNGDYERAACISVFNHGVDKAIDILRHASTSSNLNEYLALSLALSFINRLPSIDVKESNKILNKLTNPYLKALFSFKIDPENFEKNYQIYNDQQILLPDRICMAMSILKSDQLLLYVNKLTADFTKQGNLYGILLTGLNIDCIDLFQYYIHRTSDVQTPAVAIIHSPLTKLFTSKFVNGWIESYRDLLDSWLLWEQRAQYDIHRSKPSEPKISIRCTYCGDNLSSSKRKFKIGVIDGANLSMTCQACSKPSLRCTVCSLYMTIDPAKSAFNGNKDKMTFWFLFCQKCGHGGHLGHLEDWFKKNKECAAMNCQCPCNLEDDYFDEEILD